MESLLFFLTFNGWRVFYLIAVNSLIGWEASFSPKVGQKKLPVRNSTLSHSLKGWPNPLNHDVDDDDGDDDVDVDSDHDDDVDVDGDHDDDIDDDHHDVDGDHVHGGQEFHAPSLSVKMLCFLILPKNMN